MGRGLSNKLIGQAGEFAVCAQLGKLGLVATPFSGNVPYFDVLVTNESLRTLPIQVKATHGNSTWIVGDARDWMHIDYKPETKVQTVLEPTNIQHSDLIYVYIWLSRKEGQRDRYFALTKKDVQAILRQGYIDWLANLRPPGIRPKNPESYHCVISLDELAEYEDNWKLIKGRLEVAPTALD